MNRVQKNNHTDYRSERISVLWQVVAIAQDALRHQNTCSDRLFDMEIGRIARLTCQWADQEMAASKGMQESHDR